MNPLIARQLPQFQLRREDNRHILRTDCPSRLGKIRDLLVHYTRKVDPHALKGLPKLGWATQEFCLGEVLPRAVSASLHIKLPGNCHGAAIVAAGIFPHTFALQRLNSLTLWAHKVQRITREQLEPGDMVHLRGKNIHYHNGHSFVYLSDELSLSRNGVNDVLNLHSTQAILEQYWYPPDALQEHDPDILMCRKKETWRSPDELMSLALNYYQMCAEGSEEKFLERLDSLKAKVKVFIDRQDGEQPLLQASEMMWSDLDRDFRITAWKHKKGPKPQEIEMLEKLENARQAMSKVSFF